MIKKTSFSFSLSHSSKFGYLISITLIWQVLAQNLSEYYNVTNKSLLRRKRYLIFPEGSNLQLVYCLTVGAYGQESDMVIGLTAGLAWELPNTVDTKPTNLLHRNSRSVIYPKLEAFLQSTGFDGKACVMKALCEAEQRNKSEIGNGTFLQELLHAIFTLHDDGTKFSSPKHQVYDNVRRIKENCAEIYPTCQHSIYNLDF